MAPENANIEMFEMNEEFLSADEVETKNLKDIQERLNSEYEITEEELNDYTDQIKKIAETINTKISKRPPSTDNMYKTDDALAREYKTYAEKEINKDMADLWEETNNVLLSIIEKIKNSSYWKIAVRSHVKSGIN